MKACNLMNGLWFAALLLSSFLAEAEPQPLPDLESSPVVEYEGLPGGHGRSGAPAPAAGPAKPAIRPGLRAAPEQIRPDAGSVSGKNPSATAAAAQAGRDAGEAASGRPAGAVKESWLEHYPIGLIVLALAGFVFWSTRRAGTGVQQIKSGSTGRSKAAEAETGVARYLKNLDMPPRTATAETGVAKYLKTLNLSSK
jgi:hypothetical protein